MMLAGIPVRHRDLFILVGLLHDAGFDDTAEALVVGLGRAGAGSPSRSRIARRSFALLNDPPSTLGVLRAVLLEDHEGRVRDGLV